MSATREERQALVDRHVVELHSQAVAKFSEAARIQDTVNDDPAF
ncbi:hypothetical protein [Bosea sp. (in: a-proteobacteria)]|nr:hypothetical protein [Bosea sp. (in: a-proteobacteria)]HEV2510139.1 hypothetical protein [Bosea sp. (in: a-proteobacteria)]